MTQKQGAKPFDIDRWKLYYAYKRVNQNRGGSGVDNVTLEKYNSNLKRNLYKLWNRMSSGSYVPKPVRLVQIPKPAGGTRPLGIPTVEDRIAQMLVVEMIEPEIEKIFHEDSYGYRSDPVLLMMHLDVQERDAGNMRGFWIWTSANSLIR